MRIGPLVSLGISVKIRINYGSGYSRRNGVHIAVLDQATISKAYLSKYQGCTGWRINFPFPNKGGPIIRTCCAWKPWRRPQELKEREMAEYLNGEALHTTQLDDGKTIMRAYFPQHPMNVVADRLLGQLQLAGDLFVSETAAN